MREIREIALFEAEIGQNMRHLAQQIERLAVGFLKVYPETVERNNGVAGEALTTNSIFS